MPDKGYNRVPRPMELAAAPRRLRILFLYSRPPLPMTRGDELTVAHLLEFFHARGHAVDFFTQATDVGAILPAHRAWLESRCRRVEIVPHDRKRGLVEIALGLLRGWPVQIGYLFNRRQQALVKAAVEEGGYDVAYAYYIRSAEALRAAEGRVPLRVLALQLSQTLNTQRLSETAATWFERLFYRFESRRLAAYEARIVHEVDEVALIGQKDIDAIQAVCRQHGRPPLENIILAPHGVDTEQFRPGDPELIEPASLCMSGVMRYAPNVEAALWLIENVWPLVRARRPDARLYLVGRDPVPALTAWNGRDGIEVTGTVDDPAVWIARATVSVAPIRAAAGLQNKLLEAMAMGRPVVATSIANEGIGGVPDRDLLIADETEAMARAILALLDDPARRQALGAAARRFIEEHWTWEGPFLRLEASLQQALARKEGKEEEPAG